MEGTLLSYILLVSHLWIPLTIKRISYYVVQVEFSETKSRRNGAVCIFMDRYRQFGMIAG